MAEIKGHGILSLIVDGEMQNISGEFTVNLGLDKREAQEGDAGICGYTMKPQASHIGCEIVADGRFSLKDFLKLYDKDSVLSLKNGKIFKQYGAWCESDGEFSPMTGKLKFKMVSDQEIIEILGA